MLNNIYSNSPDGTSETLVFANGYYPVWTPDSKNIVFGMNYAVWEIYIADADGTNIKQLTFTSNFSSYPCVQGKPR